jgi:hypothetical protein
MIGLELLDGEEIVTILRPYDIQKKSVAMFGSVSINRQRSGSYQIGIDLIRENILE